MKHFRIALLAGTMLAASSAVSSAADLVEPIVDDGFNHVFYVRGDVGVGISDVNRLNDQAAPVLGAGFGMKWTEFLRSEVAFDYAIQYDFRRADVDAYTIMANGYFDIPLGNLPFNVQPYIGGGVGWGWVDVDFRGRNFNRDGVAFAGMFGFYIPIDERFGIDLSYKYRRIDVRGPDWQDHLLRAGVRFNLN